MFAVTESSVQAVSITVTAVVLILLFVVFKWVKLVTVKAIAVIVLLGSVLGVWSQRNDVSKCADEIQAKLRKGDFSKTTCDFFGVWKVDVGLKD